MRAADNGRTGVPAQSPVTSPPSHLPRQDKNAGEGARGTQAEAANRNVRPTQSLNPLDHN